MNNDVVTIDELNKLKSKIILMLKLQMNANSHIEELMCNKYVAYDKEQALELVRLNNSQLDNIIKRLVEEIDGRRG